MSSNIISITKIKDPTKFFKNNLNSIYVLTSFGTRNFQNDDEIGMQIKNLKSLNHVFNINETIIFRTFSNNQIIIYELFENRMHIIKTKLSIVNAFLIIDNYVLLKYQNFKELEILNYKDFKSLITLSLDTEKILLLQNIFDLVFQIILEHESSFISFNSIEKKDFLILETSKVKETSLQNTTGYKLSDNKFVCEKIWGIFNLNKEPCYVYSVIENQKRIFKYYININKEIKFFDNIFDLITFLQKNFYKIVKECTLLVQ